MARLMPAPWIYNIVTELICNEPTSYIINSPSNPLKEMSMIIPAASGRPRVVQVLRVHEKENILIVNDKKHSVAVFLSPTCVESFTNSSNQAISSLEHSMIKIEKWHFSTTVQCLGGRGVETLQELQVSMPVAINCSRLCSLGAYGCNVIGSPADINQVPSIRQVLSSMQYITLAHRLAMRVFGTPHLPDADGRFLLPTQLYGTSVRVSSGQQGEEETSSLYGLKLHHCLISRRQREKLGMTASISSATLIEDSTLTASDTEVHRERNSYWDVSEELEALGVSQLDPSERVTSGANLTMSRAMLEYEEVIHSATIDMELRESSEDEEKNDEEKSRNNASPLQSSAIGARKTCEQEMEMGIRGRPELELPPPDSLSSCEVLLPAPRASSVLQLREKEGPPDALPQGTVDVTSETAGNSTNACSTDTSSSKVLHVAETLESADVDNPTSQSFFSQSSFHSMESAEESVTREGRQMEDFLMTSSSASSREVLPPSHLSPVLDSQQEYLSILLAQNELSKKAKPFINYNNNKQGIIPPSRPSSVKEHNLDDEGVGGEPEAATQQQESYVPSPSPSASANRKKRARRSNDNSDDINITNNSTKKRAKQTNVESSNSSESNSKDTYMQVRVPNRGSFASSRVVSSLLHHSEENLIPDATQAAVNDVFTSFIFGQSPVQESVQSQSTDRRRAASASVSGSDYSDRGGKYLYRRILRRFRGSGWFAGTVVHYEEPYYLIKYDDGDIERDVSEKSLEKWLVAQDDQPSLSALQTQDVQKILESEEKNIHGSSNDEDTPFQIAVKRPLSKSLKESQRNFQKGFSKAPNSNAPPAVILKSGSATSMSKNGIFDDSSFKYDKILDKNSSAAAKFALRSIFR